MFYLLFKRLKVKLKTLQSSIIMIKWYTFLILGFVFLACNSEDDTPPTPGPDPGQSTGIATRVSLIQDEFQGTPLVIAGSASDNLIVSFVRELDGTMLDFKETGRSLPVIMEDEEGNIWDIFGMATEGPREGQQLEVVNSGMGYWFAFSSMYPETEIFQGAPSPIVESAVSENPDWLVSTQYVAQASSLDAIPAINNPKYMEGTSRATIEGDLYVKEEELIIGIQIGNQRIAYPHKILDVHELINDEIVGKQVCITYCPFTGTAKIWDRTLDGEVFEFGVSGLLYNNNLMPFDRKTESYWTQLDAWSVFGPNKGKRLNQFRYVETTWKKWLDMNGGQAILLSDDTGIIRDYDEFPYGNYRESSLITYPGTNVDNRLHPKERVHAVIINGQAKVYRFDDF